VRIPKLLRLILVRAIQVILISCAFIFTISVYSNKIEPYWIEVTHININLPKLDREFFGYRIVQISDLHAGDGNDRAHLERVIAIVNEQKPDLVVLTGDQVSRKPRQHVDLLSSLSKLQPRDRTIAILGNHDVYNDPEPIRQALKQAGVILLENNFNTIQRQNATLHIAGVGDVFTKLDRLDYDPIAKYWSRNYARSRTRFCRYERGNRKIWITIIGSFPRRTSSRSFLQRL
jgi:uncharacterized protein